MFFKFEYRNILTSNMRLRHLLGDGQRDTRNLQGQQKASRLLSWLQNKICDPISRAWLETD